jgi:signal transduction histidine kinase
MVGYDEMSSSYAPSGIACYGDLTWGAHFCHLYETPEDLIETLVPFFVAGLANHEQCVWITSQPLGVADATAALAARVPDLAARIADGQILIIDHVDWFARVGGADADTLLRTWTEAEQEALARGYKGVRATGNVSFLQTREGWSDFESFEARVTEAFAGKKLLALCSYHIGTAHACDVLDVVRNHQFALARRKGAWEIIEGSAVKEARDLEAQLADARLLQDISATIVQEEEVDVLYQKLIDAAATVTRSDFASLQRFRPEPGTPGKLDLLAHRGFTPHAARTWATVRIDSNTPCGEALRTRERVIAPDLEECGLPAPSVEAFRQTGIRSCQTTPLHSRGGTLVGMISTHWRQPHAPSERDLHMLDVIARQAADLIERNQSAEALRAYTEELLEADRRKDEFLAMLAHELRNPLAPIRTGLEVLSGSSPEAIPRVVAMMDRQLGHLVNLVDDLLDVSRVSRGKITLKTERVAVSAVIESALETSRPLVERGNHKLTVTAPGQPLWLDADPTRISQVISNIVNNAAKYTPDGGEIRIFAERVAERVEIRVADNGIGIATAMQPRVFELFAQVGDSLDRAQGGLGIGLSLAKKLVELHGGSITVESDGPGRGATFTVQLPLAQAPDESKSRGPGVTGGAPRHRVLIVDDNVDAATMLSMLLDAAGHITHVVNDSTLAVSAARGFRPDVAFLDLGMPQLDGYEVARQLRDHPELARTVLVALTGWGAEEDRERSRAAGFDHHLTKPVPVRAIQEMLAVLGRR